MRHRSILSLFITISLSSFTQAQIPAAADYGVPRAVRLDGIARRSFPQYPNRKEYNTLEVDVFFPIGWSRDGKFAYYVEPVDEACGCYFAELRIQDLRTDKVLWEFKNDPEARVGRDGAPLEDNLQKLWKRNRKLFSGKLREHGIVDTARFTLLGSKFNSNGKSYSVNLIAPKKYDEDFGVDRVRSQKLELVSAQLGSKVVYVEEAPGETILLPLDVAVAGALKSPFENRMAIVVISVHRGWEGPPHPVSIQIVGADLTRGFKK